jgi:hypothetical protein
VLSNGYKKPLSIWFPSTTIEHSFCPSISFDAVANLSPDKSLLLFFVCGTSKSKLKDVLRFPMLLIEANDLVNFNAKSSESVNSSLFFC